MRGARSPTLNWSQFNNFFVTFIHIEGFCSRPFNAISIAVPDLLNYVANGTGFSSTVSLQL